MVEPLFRRLTWEEVNGRVREGRVILLPVGAIEQHGPHLPVDTDNVAVARVCTEAASRAPDLLLCLPTVHYGFNEQGLDFPGTISVTEDHFIGYCYDVCASVARMGFKKILVVNGHGGNVPFLEIVVRLITARTGSVAALVNWWDLAADAIARLRESPHPGAIDHAGEVETSVYLACDPGMVKRDRLTREVPSVRGRWFWGGASGFGAVRMMNVASRITTGGTFGDPTHSSAEKGGQMLQAAVENLIDLAREFRDLPIQPRVSHLLP
ncbi:MAG: creatininase family protein [Armatimonadetes bacterium]|nr:creatininase family protein [Armatimonadota bacterium]